MVAMETGHFLKMLNDARFASLGFLTWKVVGCIICRNPLWVLSCKVIHLRYQTRKVELFRSTLGRAGYAIVRMLRENRAFCDTSMTFGTQLLCPMKTCFNTGPQPDLVCGGVGSHFFIMADKCMFNVSYLFINCPFALFTSASLVPFHMFHISANNIDMKFIVVSMSMFSGSKIRNMAIILVCGAVAAIFKMADK